MAMPGMVCARTSPPRIEADMTVNNSANKVIAAGTGAQTAFGFAFIAVKSSDLAVIVTDSSGIETTLQPAQYNVALNPTLPGQIWAIGGTVTYPLTGSPIPLGSTLTIVRQLSLTQLVALGNQGNEFPSAVETALDLLEMQIQQVAELFQRSIVAPVVDPSSINLIMPPAAQRANTGLAFDSQGNVIAGTTPATGLISTPMQPVVDAATLALGRTVFGLGTSAVLNIGRGLYADGAGNLASDVEAVNVFQFDPTGTIGNGSVDATAAFQAAAATGLPIFVPAGTYLLTSTITLTGNGQRMVGAGPLATILLPVMGIDCITFAGGNRGGGVENLEISAAGMTGGNAISVRGYNRVNIRNVALLSPWNGIFVTACNGAFVTDVYMDGCRGTWGINWFGSSTARSDDLSLINVVMSGAPAFGIVMDGNVDTLRMHGVACTAMRAGLVTQNSSGGPAPAFIVSHDFEVDSPAEQAIDLAGGFSGGYFANTYVFKSATSTNINIDAATFDVSFTGGRCGDAWHQGIFAGGRYIRIVGMNIFANGQAASNAWPGIEIGPASVGVTIESNHIGQFAGLAAETQNYGVLIDAGALEYRVMGNAMSSNVSGAVLDNANDYAFSPPRSSVAFNGGSSLHRLGSQSIIGSNPAVELLGFWGQTPTTRQTVGGAKGGNGALASLLSILAGYGLIVDGSSA